MFYSPYITTEGKPYITWDGVAHPTREPLANLGVGFAHTPQGAIKLGREWLERHPEHKGADVDWMGVCEEFVEVCYRENPQFESLLDLKI